ncbi:MAG: Unknown protein [uncultured Sulfurovum sp.]|uniref:Uncharacterized protein n=1 Tax=uncultured Sulfurovum sp. TaxID=269237 RepID=A0A6S6SG83_9BACT|nr:MAG: Unknown protein [uncultured Sulfurovum sp.]
MNYILPLKYFFVMISMLLLTGVWMFVRHTSLSIAGTLSYYEGKSIFGLLETVSPHLFGMAILVFVLTHFFAIISGVEQQRFKLFSLLFFLCMLVANSSVFFIEEGSLFFVLLKLSSTFLFVGLSFFAMYKLLKVT